MTWHVEAPQRIVNRSENLSVYSKDKEWIVFKDGDICIEVFCEWSTKGSALSREVMRYANTHALVDEEYKSLLIEKMTPGLNMLLERYFWE